MTTETARALWEKAQPRPESGDRHRATEKPGRTSACPSSWRLAEVFQTNSSPLRTEAIKDKPGYRKCPEPIAPGPTGQRLWTSCQKTWGATEELFTKKIIDKIHVFGSTGHSVIWPLQSWQFPTPGGLTGNFVSLQWGITDEYLGNTRLWILTWSFPGLQLM